MPQLTSPTTTYRWGLCLLPKLSSVGSQTYHRWTYIGYTQSTHFHVVVLGTSPVVDAGPCGWGSSTIESSLGIAISLFTTTLTTRPAWSSKVRRVKPEITFNNPKQFKFLQIQAVCERHIAFSSQLYELKHEKFDWPLPRPNFNAPCARE